LNTERKIPCKNFGERITTIFTITPPSQHQNTNAPMISIKTQRTNTRNWEGKIAPNKTPPASAITEMMEPEHRRTTPSLPFCHLLTVYAKGENV